MSCNVDPFVTAFVAQIHEILNTYGDMPEYCPHALQILDAHNVLFRYAGCQATDEAQGIYALRDLLYVEEDTLAMVPNIAKIRRIAQELC